MDDSLTLSMEKTISTPYQHRARKRFGQNFLHDQNVIERIVKAINPKPGQALIEIGPGQGAITEKLLSISGHVDVIEIDRDLAELLRQRYQSLPGFTLHQNDVLKFDFSKIPCPAGGFRILGNLPYNISTPLIFHLLNYYQHINDMLFMLQLEVVERMAAKAGENNYGRLSIMVQYYCKVEKLFTVAPQAFNPQPKVYSAIVKLSPHQSLPFPAINSKTLENVVRVAFSQRRKTIRNSLKTLIEPKQLELLEINCSLRPEKISLSEYVKISDYLSLSSKE